MRAREIERPRDDCVSLVARPAGEIMSGLPAAAVGQRKAGALVSSGENAVGEGRV